ncbi:phosphotransferase family protein [Mycobacterium branderi]|uniref:Aminoglycoside phosphotransferase n=1 Tax=Mycobacterium branderi TaxID=43348 RepID=A0ABM7KW93_9MYCO|nr:phosphotransferase family protein [Mycobacterium branderi]MCV7234632.1 phosphotransferase family protein [Mycobacterium branderi]BBZ15422.1 putative aminoglycoside phosphotransferase [Mycobacterium branderi]
MSDVQSTLRAVIGSGKGVVRKVGAAAICRFIESRPDVAGDVDVTLVGEASEVGASSGIVLFDVSYDTGQARVARQLVLRHAPAGDRRLFVEYDMARQFQVQRAMQGGNVPVPEPVWLDSDGRWLGVPGYTMARAHGVAPHTASFLRGPLAEASPDDREEMLGQVMKALVGIHTTDIKAGGLENFVMNATGSAPLERCINWYWRTWDWVRPPNFERLVPVRRWLLDNLPDGEPELIHGDPLLHNYMFDGTRLVAVLDWEVSTLSRAEADLAFQCVGNQLFAPPPDSGLLMPPGEAEWLAMYRAAGGRPLRDFEYFKKLAAYMLLVAYGSLRRNMTAAECAGLEPLLQQCWLLAEP